jgi:hypothetical protein
MASNHHHLGDSSLGGVAGTGGGMDSNEEGLVGGSFDYGDDDEVQLVGQRTANDLQREPFAGETAVQSDISPTREVTPVPAAQRTLVSTLCSRAKDVVGNLKSREEKLAGLCEEGVDLFSPEFYGTKKEVIDKLLREAAVTLKSSTAKNQAVAEHLVSFNVLLRDDEANTKQTPSSVAFLEFMDGVQARHDVDVSAQAAKKQRTAAARIGAQKGPPMQMDLRWDPSKMHKLPCPLCQHFTVMEITGKETAQMKVAAFKAEQEKWNALSRAEKRIKPKPVPNAQTIGTSYTQFACMCCTMTCLNGAGSCPRCKERHPGYGKGNQCICEQCSCNCSVVFTAKQRQQLVGQALAPALQPIGTSIEVFTRFPLISLLTFRSFVLSRELHCALQRNGQHHVH